jgi:hypothetical protein
MRGNNRCGQARPAAPGGAPSLPVRRLAGPAAAAQQNVLPPGHFPATGQAWKPRTMAVAGTAATAFPAAPGLALAAAGHPQAAAPLLICSAVFGIVSIVTGAVVRIYETRQRTRWLEIQNAGATAIAKAMAQAIDDAHAAAPDLPARQRAAEAASVRASAGQAITEMMPAMLAAIDQQTDTSADLHVPVPGHGQVPR